MDWRCYSSPVHSAEFPLCHPLRRRKMPVAQLGNSVPKIEISCLTYHPEQTYRPRCTQRPITDYVRAEQSASLRHGYIPGFRSSGADNTHDPLPSAPGQGEALNVTTSLLESTFLHAQGIGPTTERRLWDAGATNWTSYLEMDDDRRPLTQLQKQMLTPVVRESLARLAEEDFEWFAQKLPAGEHWRAVPAFGHRIAFVDIETTGGNEPDDLTVVGVFDGRRMHQFIKGINMHQAPAALEDAALLVTFFGTGFDLPFLRKSFPGLRLPQIHVDLCYMLRRLGYRGGLKSIESQMGISRSSSTSGLGGWDAVRLWQEYQHGRARSLETLLAYNAEDVRNMSDLLAEGYRKLAGKTLHGE